MKRDEKGRPSRFASIPVAYYVAQVVIPLLIILLGFPLATQHFAKLTGYAPQLGGIFFSVGNYPVYFPWMIMPWISKYYLYSPSHPALIEASCFVAGGAILGVSLFLLMSYARGFLFKEHNFYGTARWGTRKDLEAAGLLQDRGVVLSQTGEARVRFSAASGSVRYACDAQGELIAHNGETSTLLIGPSRSGKSFSIIPTLLSWGGSIVCFDPKGENFKYTATFRSKFSHILRFSPVSEDSLHFNPLLEIRNGIYADGDALNLADIIVTPDKHNSGGGDNSEHWNETAKYLIKGLILHVLDSPDIKEKSLATVLRLLASPRGEDGVQQVFQDMLHGRHTDPDIHQILIDIANTNIARDSREQSSVVSTAIRCLNIFQDPLVAKNTATSDFYLDDFSDSKNPISLYITVPYSDIERVSSLVRMIVGFITRRFSSGETSYSNVKMKNRILFLLDEFPILGRFKTIERNMGILPGYGITFFIVCQSANQLSDNYGKDHSFYDHCKIFQCYAPGDYQTAKLISDICGKESVVKDSKSAAGGRNQNISVSLTENERSLINPDEVMRLPASDAIVLCHGMFPYRAKKIIYYSDPRFKDRIGDTQYTRKELLKEIPHALRRTQENYWISIIDPHSKGIAYDKKQAPKNKSTVIDFGDDSVFQAEDEVNPALIDKSLSTEDVFSKRLPQNSDEGFMA